MSRSNPVFVVGSTLSTDVLAMPVATGGEAPKAATADLMERLSGLTPVERAGFGATMSARLSTVDAR